MQKKIKLLKSKLEELQYSFDLNEDVSTYIVRTKEDITIRNSFLFVEKEQSSIQFRLDDYEQFDWVQPDYLVVKMKTIDVDKIINLIKLFLL